MDLSTLNGRLRQVESRIAAAALRSGRRPEDITLVAVTKVFPAEAIQEAYALGLRHFGENYVQEFEGKHPAVAGLEGATFRLIGHLQSNKSRRAAELFQAVDTLDSPKLATRLNEAAAALGRVLDVMVEVKLSGEESKAGASPDQVAPLVDAIRTRCPHLRLSGLMTMPPWSDDPEPSRPYFARLRELAGSVDVPGLSMGMSHDLEVAIEEGATHVRVGTALFGRRVKPR